MWGFWLIASEFHWNCWKPWREATEFDGTESFQYFVEKNASLKYVHTGAFRESNCLIVCLSIKFPSWRHYKSFLPRFPASWKFNAENRFSIIHHKKIAEWKGGSQLRNKFLLQRKLFPNGNSEAKHNRVINAILAVRPSVSIWNNTEALCARRVEFQRVCYHQLKLLSRSKATTTQAVCTRLNYQN